MKLSSSKSDPLKEKRFSVRRIMKHRDLGFVNDCSVFIRKNRFQQVGKSLAFLLSKQFLGSCHYIYPKIINPVTKEHAIATRMFPKTLYFYYRCDYRTSANIGEERFLH